MRNSTDHFKKGKSMNQRKAALISVWRKDDDIVSFVKVLVSQGFEIYGSKGTVDHLRPNGIEATDIATIVGDPILGHRVVTLSREIHAALISRALEEDDAELQRIGVPRFDICCVDPYPLYEAIKKPGSTVESVTEATDIGGPAMLRSAAKGRRIVICDPADRWMVADRLQRVGDLSAGERLELAAKAEFIVAKYALASARFLSLGKYDGILGRQIAECKYGENAWQKPALAFSCDTGDSLALDQLKLIDGDAPSYNNRRDIERLLQTITHIAAVWDVNFSHVPKIAVGSKHGNPCGAGVGKDKYETLKKMLEGDPLAIFGGLVITNFEIDLKAAEIISLHAVGQGQKRILDGIVAPGFAEGALDLLSRKGGKCRMLMNPVLFNLDRNSLDGATRFTYERGGFSRQPNYTHIFDFKSEDVRRVGEHPPIQVEKDLALAWAVCATSNSNTITLVKDSKLIGNGVGQQDRVGAGKLAIERSLRSGHDPNGSSGCSDSFFPFPDGPQVLADAGIRALIATSGSLKDHLTLEVCQAKGIITYMIPDALGRMFFGH